MQLPRESEVRGALNRYLRFIDTQAPLLAEVRQAASEIDPNKDDDLLLNTSEVSKKLWPIVDHIEQLFSSNLAWKVLNQYAWLWPDLVEQRPEFEQLIWLTIPRAWSRESRQVKKLFAGGSVYIRADDTGAILAARNNHLKAINTDPVLARRALKVIDHSKIRKGEDVTRERLALFDRLLRTLLAIQVSDHGNQSALRWYLEEVWQDWSAHEPDQQEVLRPVFTRSLRELIRRVEKHTTIWIVCDELAPAFHALLSLAAALGNRPERLAVHQLRNKVLTAVDKSSKTRKAAEWDAIRQFDLRLKRRDLPPVQKVLVIQQPLKTNNRDAKLFERLTLPLPVRTALPKFVQQARDQLGAEFPWLADLTRRVCDEVESSLWLGEHFARFSPILLVSPPGIGKTRYARRLGQLLRTPLAHVVMNGMKSSMQLKGSSAGWGDSRPSVFVEHMLWMESANYFVLLDEIDKCSTSDYHGNPLDVLLSFLDRENAANFSDECLGTKVDLSRLSFIATANDCRRLPGPLLSRFRVIHVEPPERKHLGSVVLGTRDDRARDLNVDPRMLPLMTDEVEMLANAGRSPREVARLTLDYLMRRELESVRSMACRH